MVAGNERKAAASAQALMSEERQARKHEEELRARALDGAARLQAAKREVEAARSKAVEAQVPGREAH